MRGTGRPYWSFSSVKRHAIALLRQTLADDLQSDMVIVLFHLVEQALAPQSALARLRAGPDDRQRSLAHVGVAAEEVLARIGVIPVLGDRERWRALIGANLLFHDAPYRLVGLHHQILADQAGGIGEPVGKTAGGGVKSSRGVSIA